jgi:hypothetical protein
MRSSRLLAAIVLMAISAGCGGGDSAPPPPLPAGSVALSATSYTVAQSTGLLTATVTRVDGTRAVTVDYSTANGTAVAGTDYTARSGTLTWAHGDGSPKTIALPISTATANATDKTFTLTLANPTNGLTLGATTTATINISAAAQAAALAVKVQGTRLVDAAGNVLQLRGVSFSGFEFVAIAGFNPADPSGGQAGQPFGPRYSAIKAWNANTVRFALNETSWLGLTCIDTDGVTRVGDPGGNYRSSIATQVQQANAAGLYVILELHLAAPGNNCPMVQTQMANADHSLAFWTSVATAYKDNPAVLFSLYNEPFFFGLSSPTDEWRALMQGGTLNYFPATSATFNYRNINTTWNSAGMQTLLDTVRATGATNVVLIGGVEFGNNMGKWAANMPHDALNQIAAAWHPYPPIQRPTAVRVATGGSGYAVGDTIALVKPNTVYSPAVLRVLSVGASGAVTGVTLELEGRYLQSALPTTPVAQASSSAAGTGATFTLSGWGNLSSPWSLPINWPAVQELSTHVPVILSETGEHNAPGTQGAPFLEQLLPFANANNFSVVGCCWDVFQEQDNVLIKDVDGTPTDGYGRVFNDWMTGRAHQ